MGPKEGSKCDNLYINMFGIVKIYNNNYYYSNKVKDMLIFACG